MGIPCILYAVATILLAWIDAMRIKAKYGYQQNIDHKPSWIAAITIGLGITVYWCMENCTPGEWRPIYLVVFIMQWSSFAFIRLALYDILLNIFRLWTGTNPTGRIDYVSTKTNSYEDQHSEKVGFWIKRAMGMAGFTLMFLLYKVIFRV